MPPAHLVSKEHVIDDVIVDHRRLIHQGRDLAARAALLDPLEEEDEAVHGAVERSHRLQRAGQSAHSSGAAPHQVLLCAFLCLGPICPRSLRCQPGYHTRSSPTPTLTSGTHGLVCALPSAWRGALRLPDAFCSTKPRFRARDLPLALALQIVNLLDLHPLDPCKQRAEAGTEATKKGREVASSMKPASQEATSDSPKSSTRSVKRPGKGQNPKVTSGQSAEGATTSPGRTRVAPSPGAAKRSQKIHQLLPLSPGVHIPHQRGWQVTRGQGEGPPAAGGPPQLTQVTHSSIWGSCAEHRGAPATSHTVAHPSCTPQSPPRLGAPPGAS